MKILLTEFITGGGMLGEELPDSIAREGAMMLTALVRDFMQTRKPLKITILLEERFSELYQSLKSAHWYDATRLSVEWSSRNYLASLSELSKSVDYVLPVAPESDQCLELIANALSVNHQNSCKTLLSSPQAIRLCASKKTCADFLRECDLPVVRSYAIDQLNQLSEDEQSGQWIVKPDQGEGAINVRLFPDLKTARESLEEYEHSSENETELSQLILQPYVEGIHASVSLICDQGEAAILTINQQGINTSDKEVKLEYIEVNGLREYESLIRPIIESVVKAIPGLSGYIGLDLIIQAGQAYILEINPRLTTSYVGLAESLIENPAQLILDWAENKRPVINNNEKRIAYVDLADI